MANRTCSIKGCNDRHYARGWCAAHYMRWQRNGDPEGGWHAYRFDETFFDVIDTEAKAYWLGFITADGCVQSGPVGASGWQRNELSVRLKASDASHLEKLKAAMGAENPVTFSAAGTARASADIHLSSKHLVESLIRLGVTPRKSLTVQPWDGPADLMRHYWRGMVDGDGTIVRHPQERDKWHLRLLGTEACMEAFRLWSAGVCGTTAKKYPKGNIWSFTMGGLASPQALARELYDGVTVYLDRKHDLACQLMALPIRHRSRTTAYMQQ